MRWASGHVLWGFFVVIVLSTTLVFFRPDRGDVEPSDHDSTLSQNWFYLRDDRIPSPNEATVEIVLVGDVMLGRGVGDISNNFRHVAPVLARADLAMGNFEGFIAHPSEIQGNGKSFDMNSQQLGIHPSSVAVLQSAGFDLMSLANNHAYDMGKSGLTETVARLRNAGIEVVGAGNSQYFEYQKAVKHVNGLSIAFLAFNTVPNFFQKGKEDYSSQFPIWNTADWNEEKALQAIRHARQTEDIVIVNMHWGYEYDSWADPWQRSISKKLVESGADLVIGHHPHVVQETDVIETATRIGFTAYSLGNFIFDQYDDQTETGLGLRVYFDKAGLQAVEALPVHTGPQPKWLPVDNYMTDNAIFSNRLKKETNNLLLRVRPSPKKLLFDCNRVHCWEDEYQEKQHHSGIFTSGQIDLTGDGQNEIIRLMNGNASIFQDDIQVWHSPDNWRVRDLAVGDPNDDGRFELLLIFTKPNDRGLIRSHPFIIGFRSGLYRQLWGGSEVDDLIREVELGDVDGDGKQEIIVIEELDKDTQAFSVWRWHGWGFMLQWRSQPGRYENLGLLERDAKWSIVVESRW